MTLYSPRRNASTTSREMRMRRPILMTGRMPSRIILRVVVGLEPVSRQNSLNVTERDTYVVTMRCAAFLGVVMPCGIACHEYVRRVLVWAVTITAPIYRAFENWAFARRTSRSIESSPPMSSVPCACALRLSHSALFIAPS